MRDYLRGRICVLLGKRVARAFGMTLNDAGIVAYFDRGVRDDVDMIVFPHPSELNRWWNEPHRVEFASGVLSGVIERARERKRATLPGSASLAARA